MWLDAWKWLVEADVHVPVPFEWRGGIGWLRLRVVRSRGRDGGRAAWWRAGGSHPEEHGGRDCCGRVRDGVNRGVVAREADVAEAGGDEVGAGGVVEPVGFVA
jgi:hypothetical protein